MGSSREDKEAAHPEFPNSDWQERQIERVAAGFRRFRPQELEDLKAELRVVILEVERNPPQGIRDWKSYLTTCLYNRASTFAKECDRRQAYEGTTSVDPDTLPLPAAGKSGSYPRQQAGRLLARARRVLRPADYEILRSLAVRGATQTSVALLRGVHRNTIVRALRRIRQALASRPNRNFTAALTLTPHVRHSLMDLAQSSPGRRGRLRAHLILSLASGQTYAQIETRFHTARPTIAHWKQRFQAHGIDGLKPRYLGRKPRVDMRDRIAQWLSAHRRKGQPSPVSCRKIANALGVSKSTVHRILRSRQQDPA